MSAPPFVTSVRVEKSSGPHEYVTVWLRGANVGTLVVGAGDGERLASLLRAGEICATVNTTGPMAFAKCERRADVAHYDALLGINPEET
jgi:hypothetical protein